MIVETKFTSFDPVDADSFYFTQSNDVVIDLLDGLFKLDEMGVTRKGSKIECGNKNFDCIFPELVEFHDASGVLGSYIPRADPVRVVGADN